MTQKKAIKKKDVNELAKHIVDIATGSGKEKKNKKKSTSNKKKPVNK